MNHKRNYYGAYGWSNRVNLPSFRNACALPLQVLVLGRETVGTCSCCCRLGLVLGARETLTSHPTFQSLRAWQGSRFVSSLPLLRCCEEQLGSAEDGGWQRFSHFGPPLKESCHRVLSSVLWAVDKNGIGKREFLDLGFCSKVQTLSCHRGNPTCLRYVLYISIRCGTRPQMLTSHSRYAYVHAF